MTVSLTPVYATLSADVFGPVEMDVLVDELHSTIEKAVSSFSFGAYQDALSEMRHFGVKPGVVLDMPETGLVLPRAADALVDDQDDQDDQEDQEEQEEPSYSADEWSRWIEAEKKFAFSERMRIARNAKKAK